MGIQCNRSGLAWQLYCDWTSSFCARVFRRPARTVLQRIQPRFLR